MVRLAIDFEFPSRIWWEKGGQDVWDGITEGFDGSSVVLDAAIAASWLERARQVPGWEGGPEYAPHPVTLSPVNEDEDL